MLVALMLSTNALRADWGDLLEDRICDDIGIDVGALRQRDGEYRKHVQHHHHVHKNQPPGNQRQLLQAAEETGPPSINHVMGLGTRRTGNPSQNSLVSTCYPSALR